MPRRQKKVSSAPLKGICIFLAAKVKVNENIDELSSFSLALYATYVAAISSNLFKVRYSSLNLDLPNIRAAPRPTALAILLQRAPAVPKRQVAYFIDKKNF